MGIFDGYFLASDIDETLVTAGMIPSANVQKIEYFVKEGGTFLICSGRSIEASSQVLLSIDRNIIGPSAIFNGGIIYDFSKQEILFEERISEREKEFTNYVINHFPEIGIEVHTRDTCYVPNKTNYTDIHEEYENIDAKFNSFDEIQNLDWIKVLFTAETNEKRLMLRSEAEKFTDGSSVFYDSSANINGVQNLYFEQLSVSVSKGEALRKLREIFKIEKGKLCAIGDYYNDFSMLEEADISAVTSGAPDDLKSMADYITCSCAEGAVADFIDYLKQKV